MSNNLLPSNYILVLWFKDANFSACTTIKSWLTRFHAVITQTFLKMTLISIGAHVLSSQFSPHTLNTKEDWAVQSAHTHSITNNNYTHFLTIYNATASSKNTQKKKKEQPRTVFGSWEDPAEIRTGQCLCQRARALSLSKNIAKK